MDETKTIQLQQIQSKEIIEFDVRFKNFSQIISEADLSEIITVDIDIQILKIIKKFCEAHDYDVKKVKITTPLKSDKLEDHLDPQSYDIMKDYFGLENAEKIKPLVEAAYYLNMDTFKEVCLVTLGTPFYIGNSDLEKDIFKQKFNVDDLTPEEERQIMDENQPVFDKINEIFSSKMKEEQTKFEEQIKLEEQNNQQQNSNEEKKI